MTADAAIHAGTQVGAAVAAALAARELTEARVREIVREELAIITVGYGRLNDPEKGGWS